MPAFTESGADENKHQADEVDIAPEEKSGFDLHEEKVKKSKKVTVKKPMVYKFKGFAGYRSEFTELCRMIESDGQKSWLSKNAEAYSKSLDECPPCRTLYQSIFTACNVKKGFVSRLKRKNGEPAATVKPEDKKIIIRLDPSTELIDFVSGTFREMATFKIKEEANAYFIATEHLIAEMRKKEDKTIAEQHYYATLAEYIEAPFYSEGFIENEKNSVKSAPNLPIVNPSRNIDDLF